MNMGQAIDACFRKYAKFSGRACRAEYWYFILFTYLIAAAAGMIDAAWGMDENFSLFSTIWSLSVLIPGLAVGARRLHDTNKSGWWLLLPYGAVLPFYILIWATSFSAVGYTIAMISVALALILLIVWLAWPGDIGENRFGPDPKQPKEGGIGSNAEHP